MPSHSPISQISALNSQLRRPRRFRSTLCLLGLVLTSAAFAAGASARSGPGPTKNVIELRCETGGEEWFRAFVRPDVIAPQKTYWLADPRTDTWTGTTVNRDAKTLPENILWPIAVEYLAPTGMTAGGRHPYIELDAIPQAEGHIKYVPCDKFTIGCNVSFASGNHQKDWDYMVGKLREILTAAGLSERSSDWEKIITVPQHGYRSS